MKYIEDFPQFDDVVGFFSTQKGASEGYPYSREDVFAEVGLKDAAFVWPKQIHEDHIAVVSRRPEGPIRIPDTDGLITDLKNVLLTTVHADCLPVYFFDPEKGVIGLVHARWRGSAASIASKAAEKMTAVFGCEKSDIHVYIGPGISKCCFEIGKEVYDIFSKKSFFTEELADKKVNDSGETKYYIDLKGVNRRQLENIGIKPENIQQSSHCTCCEPRLFCSYRREGGTDKRMGAGLCMI